MESEGKRVCFENIGNKHPIYLFGVRLLGGPSTHNLTIKASTLATLLWKKKKTAH